MPGSIRRYAIDYDGDGRIDLVGSPADVIGSVANFLAQHGWVRDLPTHVAARRIRRPSTPAQAARIDAMVDAGSVPTLRVRRSRGRWASSRLAAADRTARVDRPAVRQRCERRAATSYVAGTQNFHVDHALQPQLLLRDVGDRAGQRRSRRCASARPLKAIAMVGLGPTIKASRDATMKDRGVARREMRDETGRRSGERDARR